MSDIANQIDKFLVSDFKFEPLETYPLQLRNCFGITGPVASGKSASEKIVRSVLNSRNAAYIGSDEWNRILSENMSFGSAGYTMYGGNLTLPEAWYIKVLIWKKMQEMESQGRAPNWILETCNPGAVVPIQQGKTIVYINTSDPGKSVERVKERGDKSGRYVSASVAASSYKWPWIGFVGMLKNLKKSEVIKIIDTDIMYAKQPADEKTRMLLANIASFENNQLEIHDLNHFLFFISRSFRVNAAPHNTSEIWLDKPANSLGLVLDEINKVYASVPGLQVKLNNQFVQKEKLFSVITQIFDKGIRLIEKHRQRMFFVKEKTKTAKALAEIQGLQLKK